MINGNSTQNLTHWKKMKDPNFLGSWDLVAGDDGNGEPKYGEVIGEIAYVQQQEVIDPRTNGNKVVVVCHFKNLKPMILNTTNLKAIEKVCKSPFMEYWKDKSVSIYISKVKAFGSMHDALRIRDYAPKPRKVYKCVDCGVETSENMALRTEKVFARQLCESCGIVANAKLEEEKEAEVQEVIKEETAEETTEETVEETKEVSEE